MTGEVSENDYDYLLEKSFNENYKKIEETDVTPLNKCPYSDPNKRRFKYGKRPTKTVRFNLVEDNLVYTKHLLPEGWTRIHHESGMYFYYHSHTGVVTWSMPYKLELEPPSVHRVPVRSIPCLSYLAMKSNGADWDKLVNVQKSNLENYKVCVNSVVSENNIKEDLPKEVKEDDLEDGEIESSDDEKKAKLCKFKGIPPNYYSIPTLKRTRYTSDLSSKENPIKQPYTTPPSSPVNKMPKLCPFTASNKSDSISDHNTTATPTDFKIHVENTEIPFSSTIEKIDFTAKFMEPQLFRNYCDKLFTFADEYRYYPIKKFQKKKKSNDISINPTKTEPEVPSSSNNNDTNSAPLESSVPSDQRFISPLCANNQIKVPNKNGFIDIRGRNESCILNMYCQHAFGMTPKFIFTNNKTGIHDFTAQCFISDTPYGIGEGKTKKLAKHNCVLKTLEILVPGFSQHYSNATQEINGESTSGHGTTEAHNTFDEELFSIFDSMEITDPRVLGLSTKLNTMTPKDIVMECMNRHCIPDHKVESKIEKIDKYNIFKFKVGDREVEVRCMNKREGQQLAAQKMLSEMHPHIQSWGGVMRLYGPGSKPVKRFDMQEMQSLLLEDRGGVKTNLIRLLRRKMVELHDEWHDSEDQEKAKFKVPFENIPVIAFHPDATEGSYEESSSH